MSTHCDRSPRRTHTRRAPYSLVAFLAVGLPLQSLHAQCVGDLKREMLAVESLSRAIERATMAKISSSGSSSKGDAASDAAQPATLQGGPKGGSDTSDPPDGGRTKSYWSQFQTALLDEELFGQQLAKAGPAQPCLREQQDVFRAAARASLLAKFGGTGEKLSNTKEDSAKVEDALRDAAASVLAMRYMPTDRFTVFFGFGSSYVPKRTNAMRFKVVSQSEQVTTPAANGQPATTSTQTKQYAVVESDSRSRPVGTTGLAVRFRDRRTSAGADCMRRGSRDVVSDCWYYAVDRLWPTTLFGSIQFGGGEGIVSGTTLGLGWKVVGDVNLLVGFGVTEIPTLRRDLRTQFDASKDGRLLVPTGENAESIMGTHTEKSWMFALGIPLALRNALTGK